MSEPHLILIGLAICLAVLTVLTRRAIQERAVLRQDLTASVAAARAERREATYYRIACSNTDDGLVIQSLDGRVRWVNPAYCRIMGYRAEEVIGQNPMAYAMRPEDRPTDEAIENFSYRIDDPNWGRLSLYRNVRKNGEEFWNQIRVSFHQDDVDGEFVILVCRDVSEEVDRENELKKKSAELAHVATHDNLTGVANRVRMMEFTNAALLAAAETRTHVGLLQIDLDKFKLVNDTYGHSAGDAVLQHVTEKISKTLRKTDLLARLGGDEFVAICTQFSELDHLKRLGAELVDCVHTPLYFEGQKITPSISVGAAMSEPDGAQVDDLLRKADLALYEVKRSGRGDVAVYDAALHDTVQRNTRRSDSLQQAISNDLISFVFQPTIETATGRVCALEVLARWTDTQGVTRLPPEFLPMAKNLGLMDKIDLKALAAAETLLSQIFESDIKGLTIACNASPDLLCQPDHLERMTAIFAKSCVTASDIQIELPEGFVTNARSDDTEKRQIIAALHAQGFRTILDQFEGGFAGLVQIESLSIAGFKTARTLMRNLADGANNRKALGMINELACDLGLTGIALGVETRDAFDALTAAGVAYAQGNWIAPPIPATQVFDWLKTHQSVDGTVNVMHPQLPPAQGIAI